MGAVQIDIYAQDRKYHDISYSSFEDIRDIFYRLSEIAVDASDGNKEALCILHDINNYIQDNDVLIEYYNIQTGENPLTVDDYDLDIFDIISNRLNLKYDLVKKYFNDGIHELVNKNHDKWVDRINIRYKNHLFVKEDSQPLQSKISEQSYKDLDYQKKYCSHINKKNEGSHDELINLIKIFSNNKNKIEELQSIQNKTKEQMREYSKRITYSKQLSEDIRILKDHYNIDYKIPEINDNHYTLRDNEYPINNCDSDWITEKITSIAEECLSEKQYLIFNLYFLCGLSQNEIANIVKTSRQNITRFIKDIVKNLQDNLKN